ncbi:hypothetical protein KC878_04690 [Candidatus Saccharibacteria bacterium]|nr:hypothetical protein [Candidatus Saccharibacteria bacterium]MCB9820957.1 hypothetical protein [Candidatus Nomurabacteria bacterium]
MLKDFLLFIKYPYTAGIIAIIWLGSAAFIALDKQLNLIDVVIIDMVVSVIIAGFGFRGKKEM